MLKVALAQIDTLLGDKDCNLMHIEEKCLEAAIYNSDIICFPEMATTGYSPDVLGCELWTLSEKRRDETDRLMSKLATDLNISIICGFVERGDFLGDIYNSTGVWIPGQESWHGVYRKIHLIDSEKNWFLPGEDIPIFDIPNCRIGIMTCHDAGYPEMARILTLAGSCLLFIPSAWNISDKDIWQINCSSRAIENGIHLIAVNRWGTEENRHFFGGSQLIDPRGKTVICASEYSEDLILGQIDFNQQAKTRLEIPYLRGHRQDIYRRYLS